MLSVQPQPLDVSAPAAVKRALSEDMSRSKWLRQEPSLDTSIRTSSSYDEEEERQPEDEEMVEMELGQQAQPEESAPEAGGVEEESMTKQRSVTFAPAPVVVPPVGKGMRATFFSRACSRSLSIALITFTAAIALAAALAHLERHIVSSLFGWVSLSRLCIHLHTHPTPHIHPFPTPAKRTLHIISAFTLTRPTPSNPKKQGLILLSLLPAVFMMAYLQYLFPLCVLRQEMLLTFFLAILYMGPVVLLENLWYWSVLTKSRLDDAGYATHSTPTLTWAYKLLSSFVRAYLVAGVFEEGAKFLALRRLRTLPYVTDPRALVTYGLCAGAAFGTVEDLFFYAFLYGLDNTIARAFLSVPVHAMTGMLIACALAEDRFLAPSSLPPSVGRPPFRTWWRIVAASVFVHGTFDLVTFLLDEDFEAVSLVLEVGLVVGGFAYVRFCLLRLMGAVPMEDDLHKRIGREKQVAAAVAAIAAAMAEEEEGRDFGVAGGVGREEWGTRSSSWTSSRCCSSSSSRSSSSGGEGIGGLGIPTTKHILTVVGAACVCCTGMLLFLYLCPLT